MSHNSWIYSEETYRASTPYCKKDLLDPGYFRFSFNYGQAAAHEIKLKTDRHCDFNNGPAEVILNEIKSFWKQDGAYRDLGLAHKRSILMYGPPGCGKSGIVLSVIKQLVEMNGVAVSVDNIHHFKSALKVFRQIQPKTPIVAVIEDIDEQVNAYETQFLELFDGASSIGEDILFLSTTNKLEDIPERIRCRPSRIDTLIEIKYPSDEQRAEYVNFLTQNTNMGKSIKSEIVSLSEEFSLADIKELVVSVYVYNKPKVLSILQKMRTKKTDEEE